MHVKYFVQLLTFLGVLLSSNGLKCAGTCNIITLNYPLGSEVLLPCLLQKSNQTDNAKWSQNSSLLVIRTHGNVTFEDPRDGRVTVFPYMFDNGNFSILIHGLQLSDLGTYCCELSQECHRVEVSESQAGRDFQWYFIVAAIGGLILLLIACSLTHEYRGMCLKRMHDSYYIHSSQNQGANQLEKKKRAERTNTQRAESDGHYEDMEGVGHGQDYENMQGEENASQQDVDRDDDYVNTERGQCDGHYIVPGGHHEQTGHRTNQLPTVYENDDFSCVRRSPQPQKALREASNQSNTGASYYVNQSEINKLDSAVKRKKRRKRKQPTAKSEERQFRNPIYGESSVQPKT